MSDSFGRQKSTRWANASVPSYGDEWDGDEYEYDSGSNDEKLGKTGAPEAAPATKPSPSSNLVLSIDQLRREDSDSGSDPETGSCTSPKPPQLPGGSDGSFDFASNRAVSPTVAGQKLPKAAAPQPIGHDDYDAPRKHTVLVSHSQRGHADEYAPPTPTFTNQSEPETPQSERSFTSDADSIQNEPKNLNLRGDEPASTAEHSTKFELVPVNTHTGQVHQEEEPQHGDKHHDTEEPPVERDSFSPPPMLDEHSELESDVHSDHKLAARDPVPAPLVLTIDRPTSSSDSDASTIEDTDDKQYETNHNHHTDFADDDDPLDSLISDLQSVSTNGKDNLPPLDSIHTMTGYDGPSSHLQDDYLDESPSTPTAPLDMSRSHQEYVKSQTPRKVSIRKAPRTELMSVDYSNIADAVSGYMNDSRPESLRREQFVNPIVEDDSSPEEAQSDLESRDLQPVVSSGSLSTGKLSLASSQPRNESKEEISRRVSTASTINMGGWKPNTNNFRDQFINDIDNESVVNFNAPGADGYRQFTNLGNNLSDSRFNDVQSNASSLSIPETIDAALPSIQEDEDHDISVTKSHDETPEDGSHFESHSTFDTVFKPHSHVQNFKELLTPTTSSVEVPQKQRYSSLLGDSTGDTTPQRASETFDSSLSDTTMRSTSDRKTADTHDSGVSDTTARSTSASTLATKKTQPVYKWNDILSKSQPVDRIRLFKEALRQEFEHESGLTEWLQEALKQTESAPSMHIGKIASQAYQNAPHNELRRHTSLRSKVSSVRDKVETSGLQASTFGKKFLNRGKKLMKG